MSGVSHVGKQALSQKYKQKNPTKQDFSLPEPERPKVQVSKKAGKRPAAILELSQEAIAVLKESRKNTAP